MTAEEVIDIVGTKITEGGQMIEAFRVPGYCARRPFRVSIDGIVQRDKKGREREFDTLLEAISWAQRKTTKRSRSE